MLLSVFIPVKKIWKKEGLIVPFSVNKNFITSLFLLFISFSCVKEAEVPEHLLQEDEMSIVMTDLMIERQKLKYKGINKDSAEIYMHSLMKPQILQKHKVELSNFDESYAFYENHPKLYHSMWVLVTERVKVLVDSADAEMKSASDQ